MGICKKNFEGQEFSGMGQKITTGVGEGGVQRRPMLFSVFFYMFILFI